MRPVYVTVSGVGVSAPIPMDWRARPFTAGIGCVVTGTVTYTVQHTYDDITLSTFDPSIANWFPNAVIAAATASADTTYTYPVRAIRMNITAGTGSVTMGVMQASGV